MGKRLTEAEVARIRELRYGDGLTAAEVARRVGWFVERGRGGAYADGARVKRALGLLDDISGQRNLDGSQRRTRRTLVDAELAGELAEAVGMARWEVDAA